MALSGILLLLVAPFFWAQYRVRSTENMVSTIQLSDLPPWEYYALKSKSMKGEPLTQSQRELVENVDALEKEFDKAKREFTLYTRYSKIVDCVASSLTLLGFFLAVAGFVFWYIRVQRPLDLILQNELKRGNLDIEQNGIVDQGHDGPMEKSSK
jgi:hypothetical protein